MNRAERLDKLRRSYDGDEAVDESYVVLTIGASLIATLGLLANNAAVVIGAMVVAPLDSSPASPGVREPDWR